MTYTHLRVGTKPFRSKPPRKGPPCTEPLVLGSNILADPGCELQLATAGGGPGGSEIPEQANDAVTWDLVEFSDGVDFEPKTSYWLNARTTGIMWEVSTANPRTGTYHIRKPNTAAGFPDNYLYAMQAKHCTSGDYFSARVEAGDYVEFSVWAEVSTTADSPTIDLAMYFYQADGATSTQGSPPDWLYGGAGSALTTSYAQHTFGMFAPANSKWVRCAVWCSKGLTTATDFDLDDFVLEVS